MKKLAAAIALACALVTTGVAGATTGRIASAAQAPVPPINWGVADDASKYADDGGSWFYDQLAAANLTENRWTLAFNPSNPSAITELPFLERAAPKAQAAGIHVVLALYSTQSSQHDPTAFCAWAAVVANTVKDWGIHDYIVWNEPNTRLYWMPQKDSSGNDVAAPAYEALLATCYDSLHAADPSAQVIGMGLSPRASTSESTEPLVFLRDVGTAYRASGRTTPIMDQLSVHPYPNPNSPADSPDVGYQVTDRYGVPNLDRVKQAVWDAFHGTGQPTTVGGSNPLTFRIDEIGWQTDTTGMPQYVNPENVTVVSERTQADYLQKMATKYFACDPTVTDVELFLLVDEKYRNGKDENQVVVGGGWQSGLLTAGGEGVSVPKLAFAQDGPIFGEGRAACAGQLTNWTPAGGTGGGSAGGGSGGGGGGAGSSPGSAVFGDPDGVISPDKQAALQAALDALAAQQALLPRLPLAASLRLNALYGKAIFAILRNAGTGGATRFEAGVYVCPGASCVLASLFGSARRLNASGATLVAFASATARAGKVPRLVFTTSKAKAKAGSYALVLWMTSTTDPTKQYAIAVALRSVGPKAKTKK